MEAVWVNPCPCSTSPVGDEVRRSLSPKSFTRQSPPFVVVVMASLLSSGLTLGFILTAEAEHQQLNETNSNEEDSGQADLKNELFREKTTQEVCRWCPSIQICVQPTVSTVSSPGVRDVFPSLSPFPFHFQLASAKTKNKLKQKPVIQSDPINKNITQ